MEALFGFQGSEFYTDNVLRDKFPALVGQRFGCALYAFDAAVVLGVVSADGQLRLNPDDAYTAAAAIVLCWWCCCECCVVAEPAWR